MADNKHIKSKLLLRRYFLDKYGGGTVIDACAGSSVIWSKLRKEYDVNYWAIDVKKKKGRHTVDSARILALPDTVCNVLDIDTYGSPWEHLLAYVDHATSPFTCFLTVGSKAYAKQQITAMRYAGLPPKTPPGFQRGLADLITDSCITLANHDDITPVEIIEAFPQTNARYIGVRYEVTTQ